MCGNQNQVVNLVCHCSLLGGMNEWLKNYSQQVWDQCIFVTKIAKFVDRFSMQRCGCEGHVTVKFTFNSLWQSNNDDLLANAPANVCPILMMVPQKISSIIINNM